jgi:hypothetical protein
VLDDMSVHKGRHVVSSQVLRAMEIVGYDKLKIEKPGTTVANDLVEANRARYAAEARVAKLEAALRTYGEAFATGRHEPLVIACETARAALEDKS